MLLSYGFVETQGLVGSIEAADAMLKAARVHLVEKREIGFGLVTIIIEGELGAVQAAVDAGSAAAERTGQFVTGHVIPRPFDDTETLVKGTLMSSPVKKDAKKADPARGVAPVKKTGRRAKTGQTALRGKTVKPKAPAEDDLLSLLQKNPEGRTLAQLAEALKQTTKELRIRLKLHIDKGRVEKVQQRYFLI